MKLQVGKTYYSSDSKSEWRIIGSDECWYIGRHLTTVKLFSEEGNCVEELWHLLPREVKKTGWVVILVNDSSKCLFTLSPTICARSDSRTNIHDSRQEAHLTLCGIQKLFPKNTYVISKIEWEQDDE